MYRKGVGIVLINSEKKIFAGKRNKAFKSEPQDEYDKLWQMPQGGIDEKEDPLNAAYRELQEETGVSSVKLLNQTKDFISYDLPEDLIPHYWKGKFIGQTQKWYLMEFEGKESEINLNYHDPEFEQHKWTTPTFLLKNIIPFKLPLYQQIFKEFKL